MRCNPTLLISLLLLGASGCMPGGAGILGSLDDKNGAKALSLEELINTPEAALPEGCGSCQLMTLARRGAQTLQAENFCPGTPMEAFVHFESHDMPSSVLLRLVSGNDVTAKALKAWSLHLAPNVELRSFVRNLPFSSEPGEYTLQATRSFVCLESDPSTPCPEEETHLLPLKIEALKIAQANLALDKGSLTGTYLLENTAPYVCGVKKAPVYARLSVLPSAGGSAVKQFLRPREFAQSTILGPQVENSLTFETLTRRDVEGLLRRHTKAQMSLVTLSGQAIATDISNVLEVDLRSVP